MLWMPPCGEDGAFPEHGIFLCCEVEHGYEDSTLEGYIGACECWMACGAPWRYLHARLGDWDVRVQLNDIQPESL